MNDVAKIVTAVRPPFVHNDRFEIVVDEVRVRQVPSTLLALAHVLAHIELERELINVVHLLPLPRSFIVLCARQTELKDLRRLLEFLALGHSSVFVAGVADDLLNQLVFEVVIDGV